MKTGIAVGVLGGSVVAVFPAVEAALAVVAMVVMLGAVIYIQYADYKGWL